VDVGELIEAARPRILYTLRVLAELLETSFPHHAAALRGEITGTRMTTDRWNRVAAALKSIESVPGNLLLREEWDVRAPALSAVAIAQLMARASMGRYYPESAVETALFLCDDILERVAATAKSRGIMLKTTAAESKG